MKLYVIRKLPEGTEENHVGRSPTEFRANSSRIQVRVASSDLTFLVEPG
jgi:predicted DNA binding CopG/RHH family protein